MKSIYKTGAIVVLATHVLFAQDVATAPTTAPVIAVLAVTTLAHT